MISRDDLHILNEHSDVSDLDLTQNFEKHVYVSREVLSKFMKWFLLGLGAAFTLSGVIFFFAYNWQDLHKFVKLSMIGSMITMSIIAAYYFRNQRNVSHILILSASVLVGVLFAVFGQIYQTGANAYDFFMGWSIATLIWVVACNFAPIWLLGIILFNTTLYLYFQQVGANLTIPSYFIIFLGLNSLIALTIYGLAKYSPDIKMTSWFQNIIFIVTAIIATLGFSVSIFQKKSIDFYVLILMILSWYGLIAYYGYRLKKTSFLIVIALSIIVMVATIMVKISTGSIMILFVSLFVMGSITLSISHILKLQKSWDHG
jgi:uncharacterized membrane protein